MSRWLLFLSCAVLGLLLLACGLFVPAHLRAVDVSVIQKAGHNTPALAGTGSVQVSQKNLGAAQLVAQAAQEQMLPNREELNAQIAALVASHPELQSWGGPDARFAKLFAGSTNSSPEPLTEFVIRLGNRERVLGFLRESQQPLVRELLRTRELTDTVIFPPALSSSGQAFDAALSICGLLADGGHLKPEMAKNIFLAAAAANRGADSQPFEQVLLDLMSMGQRFNWGQMAAFVGQVDDPETLRILANQVRKAEGQLPVLFSAVELSGNASGVAKYLMNFSQTGLKDLGGSLRYGAGGVNELLARNQRLNLEPSFVARVLPMGALSMTSTWSWRTPSMALTFKWLLYLWAGFLMAMALHFARPRVSVLERPLQVRGFHIFREILFALGFLLVVLLLSEPFLSQESQKADLPFRLHLPIVGSAVPAGIAAHSLIMNTLSLLTLLLFFVLQGLLFTACLVKLAEIRRQKAPARLKLKLLENEDHLFDAGLYLGFAGTIVSLILVSLGVIKQPSLMAAYSSTSFGIIFVSVFKIFNLRPVRRKLLLEIEAEGPQAQRTIAVPAKP